MKHEREFHNPLQPLHHFFSVAIWQPDLEDLSWYDRSFHYMARLIYLVIRGFVKNQNFIRATALSYTLLISLVPLLAVMFFLFKVLGGMQNFVDKLHPLLTHFLNMPEETNFYQRVWEFVDRVHAGALGLVGSVILVVGAVGLFVMMERSFNEIWGVWRGRPWAKRLGAYWSLMTLGPILLGAAVWLPAPGFFLIIFMTFLYKFIPYTRVRFRSAIIGGIVAALLLETARIAFTFYASEYISVEKVYGSLAAIPLFLIWVQIGWIIVLVGAEIAFADQNMRHYRDEQLAEGMSLARRETIALQLVLKVSERFLKHENPPSAGELAGSLSLPLRLVRDLLFHMSEARVIVELGETPRCYHPARPPDETTLGDVISSFRELGTNRLNIKESKLNRALIKQLEKIQDENKAELSITLDKLLGLGKYGQ